MNHHENDGVLRRESELEAEVAHLRERERRQRAIFDSAVDFAVVVTDRDGRTLEWNTGAERVFGWSSEEMIGQSVERFFTPEDRAADRMQVEMRLSLRDGSTDDERWHLRKGGERFFASGRMMLLRSSAGEHLGFIKIVRDRTTEHLAGAALRQNEERRKALLELNDRLAEHDIDSAGLADVACRALGQVLGAQLVGYGLVDSEDEIITIERDWSADGAASLAGTLRFRDYGSYIDDLKGGDTVVIDDARLDPRTQASAAALEAIGVRALVNTPVFERGRFVALLYVCAGRARAWTEADLQFIREVATRTRTVTARRMAERAARARADELRLVADALPFLVSFVDRSLTYRFANAAYQEWFGRPPDEVVGRTIPEVVGAVGYAIRRAAIDETLAGRPTRLDLDWPTMDGRRRIADIRYMPRHAPDGAVDGFYIFVQDVTAIREAAALLAERADMLTREVADRTGERDRAREGENSALAEAEQVQLALAAGAIIGTWNWHLPTDRFTVDEAFARSFGFDPALGRSGLSLAQVVETVHPDDQAGLAEAIREVVARGGRYAHQYRVRRQDGRYHWLEANGHVEHGPDGVPLRFPGVLIDVGERRALAEERDRALTALRELNGTLEQRIAARTAELMRSEEQLRQSQKMEAVGQLTGGIAHDFNNLLTGITGALELIERRIAQGRYKDIERYATLAQGSAKRAAALTHRLLAFSRRQALDPRPTEVNRLIGGMEELIRRTMGPAVHVEAVKAAGLWSALVDPNQLENALLNLCINARDAMPDGGRLTIETANRWMDERVARERDVPPGQYLSVCVSDTGTGMPPEVVAKAFDPFFTTKPLGQGTGLGLSMIYGFVRQSGGQARIYSEAGEGTMVCLYLPRHLGPVDEPGFAPEMDAAPRADVGETVLVVDDEPSVRLLVTDLLSELGYAAIEAADGSSGLRVLRSDARIDLLITDVGLPGGMNGRQVAEAARELRPDLKVLFITGYAENALIGNGQLEPGMRVLTKPFAMEALASRIREMISGAV